MKEMKHRATALASGIAMVLALAITGMVGTAPEQSGNQTDNTEQELVFLGPEQPEFDKAMQVLRASIPTAFAMTESSLNPLAVNRKNPDAVGYLQITHRLVDDVNEYLNIKNKTVGKVYYSLKDRWNPDKSVEMFWIYMKRYNVGYNLREACRRWYGSYSKAYYNSVRSNLARLMEDAGYPEYMAII